MSEQVPILLEDYYAPWDRWFENRIYPSKMGITIFFHEITKRKRAEQALKENRHLLQRILDSEPGTVYIYDLVEHRNVYINPHWMEAFGYSAEETQAMGSDLLPQIFHPEDVPRIVAHHEAWRQAGEKEQREIEYRLRDKAGQWHWLISRETVFTCDEAGRVTQILGIAHDITGRKLAEAALRESEERYRSLFENAIEGAALLKGNLVIHANRALLDLFGYTDLEEFKAIPVLDHIAPESRSLVLERMRKRERGEPVDRFFECQMLRKDGELRIVEIASTTISPGGETYTQSTYRDITERKRAEMALRESEERYRILAETSQDLIILVKRRGEIEYTNSIAARYLGVLPHDLIGKRLTDIFPVEIADRQLSNLQKVFESGQALHIEAPSVFDGNEIWLSSWLVPIKNSNGETDAVMVVSRDVTERKQAEELAHEAQRKLSALIENIPGVVYRCRNDRDWTMEFITPRVLELTGYTDEEILSGNTHVGSLGYPDDSERVWKETQQALQEGRQFHLEYRIRHRDGTCRWMYEQGVGVYDTSGTVVALEGVVVDITERKRAEELLRESEERSRSLFENSLVGTSLVKGDRIVDANRAMLDIFGYTELEDYKAIPVSAHIAPQWRSLVLERLRKRERGEPVDSCIEIQIIRKDGELRDVEVFAVAVSIANERYTQSTFSDITERKRAEKALREYTEQLHELAAYLETARENERTRIAREIHDELGQALTALKFDLSRLNQSTAPHGDAVRRQIESMIQLVDSSVDTVRRIAAELRPGLLDDLGVAAAMEWQAGEFQARTGVRCVLHLEECPAVEGAQSTALFRIFQEALTNVARHAQASRVDIRLQTSGDELTLEIVDNGVGIAPEQLTHRRSLGLRGMQERAETIGATFTVSGSAGQGTVVAVRLPLVHRKG